MRSAQARVELNSLIAKLEDWQSSVPERALRFHLVRNELRKQIGGALPSWWLWIDDVVIERYQDRVRRLGEVTEPLAALLRKADALASEVRRLGERGGGDRELTTWLEGKSRAWLVLAERLGVTSERRPDLYRDEMIFASTEEEVRLHHEAVNQLREAERVLATLSSVRAPTLADRLPELRRRLYKEGCTVEWLVEIKNLVQPLKAAADRVQDPPPELGAVSAVLTELRNWSAQMGGALNKEVEDLEQQRRFKVVDWEPGQVKELGDEAQRLRAHLLDQAGALRAENLRGLEQEIADLRQACGYDAMLETRFAQLRERPFNRPHLFQDWLAELGRLRASFKAIAQSNIGALETRLKSTNQLSQEKLQGLHAKALSDANGRAVLLLEQELRTFKPAIDVEEVLRQLRRAGEIAREVDRMEGVAARELIEIEESQANLSSRYGMLRAEAARLKGLKLEIPDMGGQIAALSDGAASIPLEERRRQASALTTSLDAVESRFVERCREQLAVQLLDVQRTSEILRRAGGAPPPIGPLTIETGATPETAVRAIFEARRTESIVRRMARDVRKELDARRLRLQNELRALRQEDLSPDDQEESQRLLRDLIEDAGSNQQPPMQRLRHMAIAVERGEGLFTRLQEVQRAAITHLADLKQRFQNFNQEHLHRFSPVWADRVAALIYGIPEKPRQWSATRNQVEVAADLFNRVESQARRLAADEVEQAAGTLRKHVRNEADSSVTDAVRELIAELDACDADTLPPATLRTRIVNVQRRS